jgi:hypothetical protein
VRSSRSFPVHGFALKQLYIIVSDSDDALKDGKMLTIKTGPFLEVAIVYMYIQSQVTFAQQYTV